MTIPLSILDLAPIVSGGDARTALRNTLDLARQAEALGYHRYWLAEHHVTPGVASSAPAVLIGEVAAATSRIRVGAGAVQTGHQTPLAIVEQFGMLDALHPGRIDLGLGHSGQRQAEARKQLTNVGARPARTAREAKVVEGLLIPKPFSFAKLVLSPRLMFVASLLQQPGATSPDYAVQLDEILALLDGPLVSDDGFEARAVPGAGAAPRCGSSAAAGARALGWRGSGGCASRPTTT